MIRPITINSVLNGWLVQCGCQSLVYTDKTKMLCDICAYLDDPDETEKRILTTEGINRKHTYAATEQCSTSTPQGPCANTATGLRNY